MSALGGSLSVFFGVTILAALEMLEMLIILILKLLAYVFGWRKIKEKKRANVKPEGKRLTNKKIIINLLSSKPNVKLKQIISKYESMTKVNSPLGLYLNSVETQFN